MEKYLKSLIFNEEFVEDLNEKIASKVDPRLYLAAYYNPKRISSDTSSEHAFWTAVTNIYALFKDCAGYFKDNFLDLLCRNMVLDESEKIKIEKFITLTEHTRHLFCHNMSSDSSETQKQLKNFNKFLKEQLQREIRVVSIPYKLELSPKDWYKLIDYFYSESQSFLSILSKSIDKIAIHNKKTNIVSKWLNLMAKWYGQSLYFQIVGKDVYIWRYRSDGVKIEEKKDSYFYKSWTQKQKGKWKEEGIGYMIEMDEPVFPYKTLNNFFYAQPLD